MSKLIELAQRCFDAAQAAPPEQMPSFLLEAAAELRAQAASAEAAEQALDRVRGLVGKWKEEASHCDESARYAENLGHEPEIAKELREEARVWRCRAVDLTAALGEG